MKIYQFKKEVGQQIRKYGSDFVMSRITRTDKTVQIGCMHLDKNGLIGYHQTAVPQLLLIVNGEGWVRGEFNEFTKVHSGEAVFWDKGEWHETKTENGLTAIVIESEELNTSSMIPL